MALFYAISSITFEPDNMTTHEELDDSPSYDKNEYYEGPSDEEDEDDGMDYYGGVKSTLPIIHYGVEGHFYEPGTQPAEGNTGINKRMQWFTKTVDGDEDGRDEEMDVLRTWKIAHDDDAATTLMKIKSERMLLTLLQIEEARDENQNFTLPREAGGLEATLNINLDIGSVAEGMFEMKTGAGGNRWWELKFTLAMTVGDDFWALDMECGGKVVGSCYANHEWLDEIE